MTFNLNQVSPQNGRIAIVTGANAGLGYEITLSMAKLGMKVVMACRNMEKAESSRQQILALVPKADLEILHVDLSKLASVRQAADVFKSNHKRLNILINNAGIMYPEYFKTEDGFESQMATNCFGHFLLTALLIDRFPDSSDSRITWLGSSAHKAAKIDFENLHFDKSYSKIASYGQSKLACLLYSFELDRKLKIAGKKILANCAHPGGVNTDLSRNMSPFLLGILRRTILPFLTHSIKSGCSPILQAALSKEAQGGKYYGPQGLLEMSGPPGIARVSKNAKDLKIAKKLWLLSVQLTGASYSF